jgi:hypothetical protein
MDLFDTVCRQRLGDGAARAVDRGDGLAGVVQSPQQTDVKLVRSAELAAAEDVK